MPYSCALTSYFIAAGTRTYGVVPAERDGGLAVDDPATAHARRGHPPDRVTADGGPKGREAAFDGGGPEGRAAGAADGGPERRAAGVPRTPPSPEQRDAARRTLVQEITELERMSA
ncbi:hypothetical protein ACIBI9_64580 [Nonomuraea sp. NPDC050451]|uniref:hypothetical protein n=1 Tax=Nonomuraea sp. NPDC050451 TaxID=3364364 RepID=UPI0037A18EE7